MKNFCDKAILILTDSSLAAMKTLLGSFFLLTLFLLSSCSSVNTKYHMVRHQNPRQSSLGFSVTPPPGDHWYEKLKNDSLFFLKIADSSDSYTIFTEAREVRLSQTFSNSADFLMFVENEKNENLVNEDFQAANTSYRIEGSLSEYCVRYQQNYQDHGMEGLRGRRHVVVNSSGLFCVHPDNSDVAIDLSYVEKSLSDVETESYRNEGEMFLASLNFYPVTNR